MANTSRVKGITVVLGGDTTGLSKALSGVNKEINSTQKQLKDVEKLLKMDPGNTELLAQKQRILNNEITQTSDKLETLQQAEKQVQQQFEAGKVSQEQYDGLKREIAETEIELKKAKAAAQQLASELSDVDSDAIEDIGDGAKKASKQMDDLADAAEDAGDSLDFGDVFSAGILVDGIGQAVDAFGELQESVKENRRIMASLEVSSQKAGYTAEETAQSYEHLYGVLGDDQTSATTLSNLQALGLSQDKLNELIDGAIGAWATYGDSIPIDSLSEAINETIRTGTVTGAFADVLNWAGTSEDAFNQKLSDTTDESGRAQLVLQELADQGLIKAGQAWQDTNEDIVNANKSQADFTENASRLSELVSPVVEEVSEAFNELSGYALDAAENVDWEKFADDVGSIADGIVQFGEFLIDNSDAVVAALEAIAIAVASIKIAEFAAGLANVVTNAASLTDLLPALGPAVAALSNPVGLVVAAIAAAVGVIVLFGDTIQSALQTADDFLQNVFATDFSSSFGFLGDILDGFIDVFEGVWDFLKNVLTGVIDFIKGVFTLDWERAWKGLVEIVEGLVTGIGGVLKGALNIIIGLVNGLVSGINLLIGGINKIPGIEIPTIPKIPQLAKGGVVKSGLAIVGEAGPELLTVGPGGTVVQPLSSSERANPVNQTSPVTFGDVNIDVYAAPGMDVNQLADSVAYRIQILANQKGAAF